MTVPIILSLLFALVSLFSLRLLPQQDPGKKKTLILVYLLLNGLLLRILLGLCTEGYSPDIPTFKAWASMTHQYGLSGVYYTDAFLDYPPLYLYVLYALEGLRKLFSLDYGTQAYTFLIKLPSILADCTCAWLLWKMVRKHGETLALFVCGAHLFCPAVIINSAVWGQVDSFYMLLIITSLFFLYENRFCFSGAFYGMALLMKPQALIFAPLYLFYVLKEKKPVKLLWGLGSAAAVIFLFALPFTRNFDFLTLFERYRSTLQSYDYFTINAYNFYALIGFNWKPLSSLGSAQSLLTYLPIVVSIVGAAILYLKSRRRDSLFLFGYLIISTIYMFSVKMHERYIFPALLLLLVSFALTRDKRLFWCFSGLSFTQFLNVAYVLHLNNTFVDSFDFTMIAISACQMLVYLYSVYVVVRISLGKPLCEWGVEKRGTLFQKLPSAPETKRLEKRDFLPLAAVTAAFAILAFWNLGSLKNAQTSWQPEVGETAVLKVDGEAEKLIFLPGIGELYEGVAAVGINMTVEVSEDGQNWSPFSTITESSVFEWNVQELSQKFTYVRLTANDKSNIVNEIGFKAKGEDRLLSLSLVSGGSSAAALCDEQDTVPLYPTSYNSTYFDEIYHARTAYEMLHGYYAYENTHPPLGKLFISAGIALFGMTPFGWRFSGVLFGILMLPVLYALLKRFFGRTIWAFGGTFLFAFDFMHFTQSRIATIDTYAVFFVLLMYYFMAVFLDRDFLHASFKKLFPPLLLCGISFGLGAASKWTVIYGGIGLAVLFFWKLISCGRRCKKDTPEFFSEFLRKAASTVLACFAFFLVIPFCIYFLAFVPVLTVGSHTMNEFFRYQENMYSYHANLVATHSFSSEWYKWPFTVRPVWYYVARETATADGSAASIAGFGSPVVWWLSAVSIPLTAALGVLRRDKKAAFICAGFLSVYLPWVLVPRIAFLYHYYTAIPFVVLSILYCIRNLSDSDLSFPTGKNRISLKATVLVFLMVSELLLFMVFYPVLSGAATSGAYLNSLEWFSTWIFY